MSESEKITMHRVAVDMYKMEKDQYWVRTNILLLLNSAFLVAFTSDKAGKLLQLLISVSALTLCISWTAISLHSEYYIKRWREIIRNIEADLQTQPFLSFPKDSIIFSNSVRRPLLKVVLSVPVWFAQGGPSRVMHAVLLALCALWTSLAVLNVLGVQLRDIAPPTAGNIDNQNKAAVQDGAANGDSQRRVESQAQVTALLKSTASTLESMQARIDSLIGKIDRLKSQAATESALLRGTPILEGALTHDEWTHIQRSLLKEGFNVGSVDGLPGPRTRQAIAVMQARQRVRVDGHLSLGQFTDLHQLPSSD